MLYVFGAVIALITNIFGPLGIYGEHINKHMLEVAVWAPLALTAIGAGGWLTGHLAFWLGIKSWTKSTEVYRALIEHKNKRAQTIRLAESQSLKSMLARCRAGIDKAEELHEGDRAMFIMAAEKLTDILRVASDKLEKLNKVLGSDNDDMVTESLEKANMIYPEVSAKEAIGDFAEKLRAGQTRLLAFRRQLKSIQEGIVFICENLWVATAETMFGDKTKLTEELQQAVAELMAQVEISVEERESVLTSLTSGALAERLSSAMRAEEEAYFEAGRGLNRDKTH